MSYEPPQPGSPCWIEIASTDIARAKEFYSTVFAWKFQPATEDHPADKIAMFNFPDPKLTMLGGGIVQDPNKIKKGGAGVYFFVEDVEDTLAKIKEAGGKPIGDKEPEGVSGWIQHYEDTEGNFCGIYSPQK